MLIFGPGYAELITNNRLEVWITDFMEVYL